MLVIQNIRKLKNISGVGVYTIQEAAFKGCTSLVMPEFILLLEIESKAFCGCSSLTQISLSCNNTIASNTFEDCFNIQEIIFDEETNSEIRIRKTETANIIKVNCSKFSINNNNFDVMINKVRKNVSTYKTHFGFINDKYSLDLNECKDASFIKIKANEYNQSYFKDYAFVLLPQQITEIDTKAFTDCIILESINIPYNVIDINGLAFENCEKLTSVVFDDSSSTWHVIKEQETIATIEASTDSSVNANNIKLHCDGINTYSENRGVERYLSPESGKSITIFLFSFSFRLAT